MEIENEEELCRAIREREKKAADVRQSGDDDYNEAYGRGRVGSGDGRGGRMLNKLRRWLIIKLAGDMGILLNVHLENVRIGIPPGSNPLVAGSIFKNIECGPSYRIMPDGGMELIGIGVSNG